MLTARFRAALLFSFLISAAFAADGPATLPIRDEALRFRVLKAEFPGAQITSVLSGQPRAQRKSTAPSGPWNWASNDAFEDESTYNVQGHVLNQIERCASEDVTSSRKSLNRAVRLKLFWSADSSLVAVIQYEFVGVFPAGACWSIGMAARLEDHAGSLALRSEYLFETFHHTSMASVQLINLSGGDQVDLVVDSDWGGAGVGGSSYYIFDLRQPRLRPVIIANSKYEGDAGKSVDRIASQIDAEQTRRKTGASYCFIDTTTVKADRLFDPPKVSRYCHAKGYGVNDARALQAQLGPPKNP